MQITKSKIQCLSTTILIVVGVLAWALTFGGVATALDIGFDYHDDTAHGNTLNGVYRSTAACDKWPGQTCTGTTGSCAHCHDTFDSNICGVNELMLFADVFVTNTNQFCTKCHSANADYQPVTTNYPYSVNFGGYTPTYYGHIKKQIGDDHSTPEYCGSRHNMRGIRNYVKNDTNGWGFGSDPSPCVACHNPHTAQRNYPVAIEGGKLNTAIRRPSDHNSTDPADSLWGDGAEERMSYYASQFTDGVYQAPYYGDTSADYYEPSGNATPSDGSDLPDYVTFCLDCHQYEQSDPDNSDRTVKAIDYSQERHGSYPSNDCTSAGFGEGFLKPPYVDSPGSNYVLSCLDCHEPHGAKKRKHLLRRMINGQEVALDSKDKWGNCYDDFDVICEKCHYFTYDHLNWGGCTGCHGVSSGDWHGSKFLFGSGTDNCNDHPSF